MFDNIGKKIKALAAVMAGVGIAVSVISGMVLMANDEEITGIIVLIIGSLLSWTSCFCLFGFGDLVDNSAKTAANSELIVRLLGGRPAVQKVTEEYVLHDEKGEKRILKQMEADRYCDDLGNRWRKVGENEFERE